jgi:acetyl/propionyl-CoA carboxylase alpha subunit
MYIPYRGYHGEDQTIERLKTEAEKIGYPVLIKVRSNAKD